LGNGGLGVAVIRSDEEAQAYFSVSRDDIILQEYIEGLEFGVFYYRFPQEESGNIFAITDKRVTTVTGDGICSLEKLILDDARAVAMAPFFFNKHVERLFEVLAAGEEIRLAELRTHSRGSLFLDGSHLATPELEAEMDRISKCFDGFYFGRYDIKVPSTDASQQGKDIRVLELNGITSEATSIYDPKNGLFTAYRVLFNQWSIASKIVEQNGSQNIKPAKHRIVNKQLLAFKNHEKVEV